MKRFVFAFVLLLSSTVAPAQGVNFSQHIAPIIYNNCTSCHRPGEIGPMPFTSYQEVAAFGSMVQHVTGIKYMPPWKPDSNFSHFIGERGLSSQEIQQISDWVTSGMPQGDPALEPPLPVFPTGSQLGTPDLVVSMSQKFQHQGNNQDRYQIFVIPSGVTADKDIAAVEVRPSNKRIAHHSIIALDTTGQGMARDTADPDYGYAQFGGFGFTPTADNWAGWTPGNTPGRYPNGIGKKLFKNADLLLQMHYGPSAAAEEDSTYINIFYAQQPSSRFVQTYPMSPYNLLNGPFVIPANQVKTFHGRFTAPFDVSLLSVYPHMHLLGKSWLVYAVKPNGDTLNLIKIDDWDFKWQSAYRFPSLLKIPAGSKIHAYATYDNTVNNLQNPHNPPQQVTWGEETTAEMYLAYLDFVPYQAGDENILLSSGELPTSLVQARNKLYPVYPNPARGKLSTGFSLEKPGPVMLTLHDLQDRLVRTWQQGTTYAAGPHQVEVEVDGLSAGAYLLQLRTGSFTQTEKVILTK